MTTPQWFRIDITDVSIEPVTSQVVEARAFDLFGLGAHDAMAIGRFRNPWAHYVREEHLTDAERELPRTFRG